MRFATSFSFMKFACYFFGVTSVDVHFRSTSLHSKRSLHRFNHTLSYRHCHLFWASSLKIANEACFLFFSFELFSDPMSSSSGDSEMMLQGSIPFGPFHIVQISSGLFVCLRTTSLDHFRLVAGFRSRPDRWFWRNSKSGDNGYVVRQTILIRRRKILACFNFGSRSVLSFQTLLDISFCIVYDTGILQLGWRASLHIGESFPMIRSVGAIYCHQCIITS